MVVKSNELASSEKVAAKIRAARVKKIEVTSPDMLDRHPNCYTTAPADTSEEHFNSDADAMASCG